MAKRMTQEQVARRDARIAQMLHEGISYDEICAKTGVCKSRISHVARQEGLLQRVAGRVCSVDGCENPHNSLGYCRMHYVRTKVHGTTNPRPIIGPDRDKIWRRNNPENLRESTKRWRASNPEKRRAHRKVEVELRTGRMSKKPCEVCGNEKSQAHHDDYAKPLDVIWLCALHHKGRHRWLARQQESAA